MSRYGVRRTLTPRRRKREVETAEFAAMLRRLLRAYVRRVGDQGDLDAFAEFARLLEEGEGHLLDMVAVLRHEPWSYSWAEVGRVLGISRQSAQERFRKAGGARRAGGQPGNLR
ncbi:MAG TPA: hypothetical protein VGJ54_07140 [Streptosporangiaceae bacterium]